MNWQYRLTQLRLRFRKHSSEQRHFFLLHIPKTAGTTFRYLLYQLFDQETVFPNKQMLLENNHKYLPFRDFMALPQEVQDRYRLVHGHYSWGNFAYLKQDYHALTFLREPVARTLSNLWHFHFQAKHEVLRGLPLEEIYSEVFETINNQQVRYLTLGKWKRLLTEADLTQAKEHLDQMALVGITEQFDASVKLAEKQFGWTFLPVGKLNIIAKEKPPVSDKLIEKITQHNQLDRALYDYAYTLFEKRCQVAGIDVS